MRILVTRPEPDAIKLKAKLESLDHEVTVEPLLAVDFSESEPVDLTEVQAIIATSRNGLRALKHQRAHTIAAKLPLYAVGAGTAQEGRNIGFEWIVTGPGSARDLIPKLVSTLDPQSGLLLHLAGDRLAFDLGAELQLHGFRLMQPVVYRMVPAESLAESTIGQIESGEIEAVLLLSPRTAEIWVKLLRQHKLERAAGRLLHVCLSPAIAQRLKPLGPLRIVTAEAPTMDGLLALMT